MKIFDDRVKMIIPLKKERDFILKINEHLEVLYYFTKKQFFKNLR